MTITKRLRINTASCTSYREKPVASTGFMHVHSNNIGIIIGVDDHSLNLSEAEADALVEKIAQFKLEEEQRKEDRIVDNLALQIERAYLKQFGEAIHDGTTEEPMLARDFNSLRKAAGIAFGDVADRRDAVEAAARARIHIAINYRCGYEHIKAAIKKRTPTK